MSNLFNGKIDLGPTPEMFAAFAKFGELSPGEEFGALHGALQAVLAEDDELKSDYISDVANQAGDFAKQFSDKLDPQAKWILKQLQTATPKPT